MLERLKQNLEARALTSIIVAPVFFVVIGFLGLACFLALSETLAPAMAALVTAGVGVMLIIVLLLGLRLVTARNRPQSMGKGRSSTDQLPPFSSHLGAQFEAMLQDHADPVLANWIRDNPDRAMAATLMLGMAAGYSDSVQRVLLDLYRHYASAESARRRSAPDPGDSAD